MRTRGSRRVAWTLFLGLCISSISSDHAEAKGQAKAWTSKDFPRCPASTKTCIGITVHATLKSASGGYEASKLWLSQQLQHANTLFTPMGMVFEIAAVKSLPGPQGLVETREHRDALGAQRHEKGTIHLFLVKRLANVDEPGIISGVHWRLRSDRRKRWVILAGSAARWVLAHELGHFFSLPHSTYPASVMNKRSSTRKRPRPPALKRHFVKAEKVRIGRDLKRQLRARILVSRAMTKSLPTTR